MGLFKTFKKIVKAPFKIVGGAVDVITGVFDPPKVPDFSDFSPPSFQFPSFEFPAFEFPEITFPEIPAPPTPPGLDKDAAKERQEAALLAQKANRRRGRASTILAGNVEAAEAQEAEGLKRRKRRTAIKNLGRGEDTRNL